MANRLKTLLLACQLLLAGHAHALLIPGADAPDFSLEAAVAGQPFRFSLAEALQKGPVVVYFYPKSFTGGCSVQARMFSRAMGDFAALGATVIGVSNDGIDTQKEFSVKECSNALAVAADPEGSVVRAYDASMLLGSGTSKRVSYVITPDRKIYYVYSDMSPQDHVTKTLEAVRAWKAAKAQ